jgi:hypothetical protein
MHRVFLVQCNDLAEGADEHAAVGSLSSNPYDFLVSFASYAYVCLCVVCLCVDLAGGVEEHAAERFALEDEGDVLARPRRHRAGRGAEERELVAVVDEEVGEGAVEADHALSAAGDKDAVDICRVRVRVYMWNPTLICKIRQLPT